MKKIYIILTCLGLLSISSCDKFLDKLPDQRATINTQQKAIDLLVSAYPNVDPMGIYEHRSDNAMDNGLKYGNPRKTIEENYLWKNVSDINWDCPQKLWESCYGAIATANQVLSELKHLTGDKLDAIRGEALLCRAYSHFLLVNTFCVPYSEKTADKNLGIPYVDKVETKIGTKYQRGTVAEVYDKIDKDITEGYKLIDDNLYSIPLYHFNKKAASAFATRFYLFYRKYDKALEFANMTLGDNVSSKLRDVQSYTKYTNSDDWRNAFISKNEPANLLNIALRSLWGRDYINARYGNSTLKCNFETYRSSGPWGVLSAFNLLFGGGGYPVNFQPKYNEIFEIMDVTARTGQPHVVQMAFTVDETLLCRAEIYALLKEYDKAAEDLSTWCVKKGGNAVTVNKIVEFYTNKREQESKGLKEGTIKPWLVLVKPFNVDFEIEPTTQEPVLQAVLHARRIETMFSGLRWLDIRRYGIEVVHNIDEKDPITLKANDPRRVIQIPEAIVSAGLEANPM